VKQTLAVQANHYSSGGGANDNRVIVINYGGLALYSINS